MSMIASWLAFADYAVTVVGYFCLLFGTIWLVFF